MMALTSRRPLWLLLAVYCVLAGGFALRSPIFEVSDELWHYPMVDVIARNGFALPVQQPGIETAWRQEGSQPPLYYLMAALLTSGIDTGNLADVRRINPHADIGIVRPPYSANMIVHDASAEAFSWRGAVLAVYLVRLLSVLLGAGTVAVTWFTARALFPDRPAVTFGATAINACLPMFLFISGSVNNDNLSNLLGNLLCLLVILLLQRAAPPRLRDYVVIGVVTGAGLLAKLNIGFLVPVIGLAFIIASIRHRSWRPFLLGLFVSGGLTILIAGWWYLRNAQLYGDVTGLNVFLDIVGRRPVPASLGTLWAERGSFLAAFWGMFGGMNVPLPDALYTAFNVLGGLGLAGAAAFFAKTALRREWTLSRWLPFAPPLLWLAITFLSYLRWTADTPASQGRLIFGALSTLCVLFALGLTWPLPKRIRALPVTAFAALLGAASLLSPWLVIAPAYTPDMLSGSSFVPSDTVFTDGQGGSLRLNAGEVSLPDEVLPGEDIVFETIWRSEGSFAANWSMFVHLVTEEGAILAQRDMYPARGLLATSDLADGTAWRNPMAVSVPALAPAPLTLSVVVGWFSLETGARLTLPDGTDALTLGTVDLTERPASEIGVPNPVSINLGDQMRLVGYEISTLAPRAGSEMTVTLYWQAIAPMTRNYTVFVQVLDRATLRKAGESNAQPAGWTRPTSAWSPGEIVTDTHPLAISPDAPPETYVLDIGAFVQASDGSFERLRIIAADGAANADAVELTRLRVLPGEMP
jgi:4-amino-4-deoxy-L-arabinose transferase-like glycosyltransferase